MEIIISQPFLCVAAILEAILRCNGIKSLDQEEIAEFFGVHVPLQYDGTIRNVTRTENVNLYGIRVEDNGINNFFDHYNLPFNESFLSVFTFNDWQIEDIVKAHLANNSHVVCGFDYGELYGTVDKKLGHVSLITAASGTTITLLDPGPIGHGTKHVNNENLFSAIKAKRDGLWIIARK